MKNPEDDDDVMKKQKKSDFGTAPQNHFFLLFLYRAGRCGLGDKPSVPLVAVRYRTARYVPQTAVPRTAG
jgi:hypothetical protein